MELNGYCSHGLSLWLLRLQHRQHWWWSFWPLDCAKPICPLGWSPFPQIILWRSSLRMKILSRFWVDFPVNWLIRGERHRPVSLGAHQSTRRPKFMFAQANEHLAQRPHCLTLRQLTAKRQVWGKALKKRLRASRRKKATMPRKREDTHFGKDGNKQMPSVSGRASRSKFRKMGKAGEMWQGLWKSLQGESGRGKCCEIVQISGRGLSDPGMCVRRRGGVNVWWREGLGGGGREVELSGVFANADVHIAELPHIFLWENRPPPRKGILRYTLLYNDSTSKDHRDLRLRGWVASVPSAAFHRAAKCRRWHWVQPPVGYSREFYFLQSSSSALLSACSSSLLSPSPLCMCLVSLSGWSAFPPLSQGQLWYLERLSGPPLCRVHFQPL